MRDRLDEVLDEALAGYVAEPRAGLERRVLHRMRTKGKQAWFVVPVFAVAVVVCLFVMMRQERVPVVVVPEVRVGISKVAATPVVVKRVVRRRVALPRRDVFPSPTGLTDGERALLALMQRHPEMALEVSKTKLGLIEIQPIEILPLQAEIDQ
jgi:hypothetical protein